MNKKYLPITFILFLIHVGCLRHHTIGEIHREGTTKKEETAGKESLPTGESGKEFNLAVSEVGTGSPPKKIVIRMKVDESMYHPIFKESYPNIDESIKSSLLKMQAMFLEITKDHQLIDLNSGEKVPVGCYPFVVDQKNDKFFIIHKLLPSLYVAIESLSQDIEISSAGRICLDDELKISTISNDSEYSNNVHSNSNFVGMLHQYGMDLSDEFEGSGLNLRSDFIKDLYSFFSKKFDTVKADIEFKKYREVEVDTRGNYGNVAKGYKKGQFFARANMTSKWKGRSGGIYTGNLSSYGFKQETIFSEFVVGSGLTKRKVGLGYNTAVVQDEVLVLMDKYSRQGFKEFKQFGHADDFVNLRNSTVQKYRNYVKELKKNKVNKDNFSAAKSALSENKLNLELFNSTSYNDIQTMTPRQMAGAFFDEADSFYKKLDRMDDDLSGLDTVNLVRNELEERVTSSRLSYAKARKTLKNSGEELKMHKSKYEVANNSLIRMADSVQTTTDSGYKIQYMTAKKYKKLFGVGDAHKNAVVIFDKEVNREMVTVISKNVR